MQGTEAPDAGQLGAFGAALVGIGAAAWQYLKDRPNRGDTALQGAIDLMKVLKEDNQELRAIIEKHEATIQKQSGVISELRNRVVALEHRMIEKGISPHG